MKLKLPSGLLHWHIDVLGCDVCQVRRMCHSDVYDKVP